MMASLSKCHCSVDNDNEKLWGVHFKLAQPSITTESRAPLLNCLEYYYFALT